MRPRGAELGSLRGHAMDCALNAWMRWGRFAAYAVCLLVSWVPEVEAARPRISGTPATTVAVGQAYSFQPTASDADNDPLTFSIQSRPAWASFSTTTGRLSGTPTAANVGTTSGIVIRVSDGSSTRSLPSFSITVTAPNVAPTISGTPATSVTAGQAYVFQPTASDVDSDPLTFSITGMPTWATFNTTTGRLSGTPTTANVGTTPGIVISVTDGRATRSLPSFAITVSAPRNTAPTITGTPATDVTVGQAYSFQPTASDADNDPLTFSIQGKPAWALFNAVTGALAGVPAATDVGASSPIQIRVSDGTASSALAPFVITVVAPQNTPPTISGTPVTTATVGQPYAFQATANDGDGDNLIFTIQGNPPWTAFATDSGVLSGVPGATDVGTTGQIIVGVYDGHDTTHLPGFTITVTSATAPAQVLTWSRPLVNTDGTAATNITGYKVFYGPAAGAYDRVLEIAGADSTSVVIEGLTPGTWHFAVKAVNSFGAESDHTNDLGADL